MDTRPLTELTEYRLQQNPPLTRAAIATLLKVSRAAVCRWEKGDRAPDRQNLKKIAELTGAPQSQLAGFDQ